MTIDFKFRSIESTGGDTIELPATGMVCIVGGNNVGKSQLLRELHQIVTTNDDEQSRLVVSSATAITPQGTAEEALEWLEQRAVEYDVPPGTPREFAFRMGERGMSADDFSFWLGKDRTYLGNIANFFIEYASAGSLRSYAQGYVDPSLNNVGNYALLKLRSSGELEEELSAVSQEAFGLPLVLDRLDPQTRLRVGSIHEPVPPLNRPSKQYARALSALPALDAQGDGVRSFIGLASQVITHSMDVLLVDEPEAFLHPGQARVLGRWLATEARKRGMQVIVATHDRDFVVGALSADDGAGVALLRVTREGAASRFTKLSPNEIADLWSNPVLRFSNVLQGLFHGRVVACEADSDCRFYGAAIDFAASESGRRNAADDLLLVPSGGKGQLAPMLDALSKLGVETWALPDLDILRQRADVKRTLAALGGSWTERHDALYTELATEANRVGWEVLKRSGLSTLGSGDAYRAGKALLDLLDRDRLRIVRTGEMESFYRESSMHGSSWVSEALGARVHESQAVKEFVLPILG